MTEYDITMIVKNMYIMFEDYWNVTFNKKYSDKEFLNENFKNGYVFFVGVRDKPASLMYDASKHDFYVFIATHPDYHTKKSDFDKLVSHLPKKLSSSAEVYIISKELITASHIMKRIDAIQADTGVRIKSLDYRYFVVEIPKRIGMPKCEIIKTEEEYEPRIIHKDKADLRCITLLDPMIVWHGASLGDIVRITRMSETTAHAIVYNRVIP